MSTHGSETRSHIGSIDGRNYVIDPVAGYARRPVAPNETPSENAHLVTPHASESRRVEGWRVEWIDLARLVGVLALIAVGAIALLPILAPSLCR